MPRLVPSFCVAVTFLGYFLSVTANTRDIKLVALAHDVARAWLDAQFTALDCEPLRASGKVLTADKVLRVTEAAGVAWFENEKWAAEYVKAVHGALKKAMIRVDVPAMAITY